MIPLKLFKWICEVSGKKVVPYDSIAWSVDDLQGYAKMIRKSAPDNQVIDDVAHDLELIATYLKEIAEVALQ